MAERPAGQRYSLIYLDRGDPSPEISPRARNRIARLINRLTRSTVNGPALLSNSDLANFIEYEMGINVWRRNALETYVNWERSINEATTGIILDIIWSTATLGLKGSRLSQATFYHRNSIKMVFIPEIRRILSEENLAYEIDDEGGVRPLIDSTFSQARAAAIRALSKPRYEASLRHVEKIDKHLMIDPPDYTQSIRAIFDANENLFKLMFNGALRLSAKPAAKKLEQSLQRLYNDDNHSKQVSAKTIGSFAEWIDAAHFYRHEPGMEEPSQPPEEIAVLLISQGLSFVRWLSQIDCQINPEAPANEA